MGHPTLTKKGFVYVLINPSMPGLVKVGMTKRIPTERTTDDDMDSTGIPTPFEVQYYSFFDDMVEAEKRAHSNLSNFHYAKEFFKTDVATAVHAIESTGVHFTRLFSKEDYDRKKAEIETKERIRMKEEQLAREKLIRASLYYYTGILLHEQGDQNASLFVRGAALLGHEEAKHFMSKISPSHIHNQISLLEVEHKIEQLKSLPDTWGEPLAEFDAIVEPGRHHKDYIDVIHDWILKFFRK